MNYTIEKHINGYCLVSETGNSVATGAPHNKGTLYLEKRKEAEKLRDLMSIDTLATKDNWTPEHYALFETIHPVVRDIAGDLFEIKWYQGAGYDEMLWEIEHNLLGKQYLAHFKREYDELTNEQKNLIYYAYEA